MNFHGKGNMKLVAKSAGMQLEAAEEVLLKSQSVVLDSKQLYVSDGIRYFDNYLTVNLDATSNEVGDNDDKPSVGNQLMAYNLVAVNGILMAD